MQLSQLIARVNEGEVVPVEYINNRDPVDFVNENPNLFNQLTIQNDREKAGVVWIFNPTIRQEKEFNL